MTEALLALAAAVLVASALAALGSLVAGPGPEGITGWNSRFQIGSGAAALALFPLSLAAHRATLPILAAALGVVLVFDTVRRIRARSVDRIGKLSAPVLVLVGAVVLFAVLNARIGLVTDGVSIWTAKGIALHEDRALTDRVGDLAFLGHYAPYPPLVPMSIALVGVVLRGVDAVTAKGIQPLFLASLLVSVFDLARRVLPRRHAVYAPLIAAFVPAVSSDWNAGGFADLALAAFVAGAAAALLDPSVSSGWRSPAAWHLAAMTTIKPEGALLAVVAVLAVGLGSPRTMISRLSRYRRELVIVGAALLLGRLYTAWIAAPDFRYGFDRDFPANAARKVLEVAGASAAIALRPSLWGLFWPAFLAASVAVFRRGTPAQKRLAAAAAGAAFIGAGIFLLSRWTEWSGGGIAEHIAIAYPRLLEQVAGLAAVVIVAGYGLVFSGPGSARGVTDPV